MNTSPLKSVRFRVEREATWRELDEIVAQAESNGLRRLAPEMLLRLPILYRATISSLSVARSISLDRNVLSYLEGLTERAYFFVYGTRSGPVQGVSAFLTRDFPSAVRAARLHIMIAALFLTLGAATGFVLTQGNEDWFYSFVGVDLAQGRTPTATTATLKQGLYDGPGTPAEELNLFAAFLFSHNAKIGMLSFALGFAFGIPVILLILTNGLMLGAFMALYHSRGLSLDLLGWLFVHGTTEILALVLCAGAGLVVGDAIAFPGRHGRVDNLVQRGRLASRIVIGAVLLFLVAALLEGFARQLVTDPQARFLIGGAALTWWLVYFATVGRTGGHGSD